MWGIFDLDFLSKEISRIEEEASKPEIWNDQENAKVIMRKLSLAKKRLSTWNNLEKAIKDLSEIMETSEDSEIEDFKEDFLFSISIWI